MYMYVTNSISMIKPKSENKSENKDIPVTVVKIS